MARIRSLKPEHKRHRKIGPLSDREYRLWVGMLTEADDEGRLVADVRQLRLEIFGYHPRVTVPMVAAALEHLHDVGLVQIYTVGDERYVQFPSWKDHQVINRAKESNLPPPLHSLNGHGTITDQSVSDHGGSRSDLIGSDLIGGEHEGRGRASANGGPPPASHIEFRVPKPVIEALDRCPRLGAVPRLRTPSWWQAELRANTGVALEREVFKAEAYLVAHPEKHYAKLDRFLHGWLGRADREAE